MALLSGAADDSIIPWLNLELSKEQQMKGNAEILAVLQEVLKAELTAINQYFLHGEMLEHWGYKRLAQITKKESIEEMEHAEKCIERLLYLDAMPNMSDYFKINIGGTIPKQYQNDLDLECKAVERLNRGIALCAEKGDNGTRELLQQYPHRRGAPHRLSRDADRDGEGHGPGRVPSRADQGELSDGMTERLSD